MTTPAEEHESRRDLARELTRYADCSTCPLKPFRDKNLICAGRGPLAEPKLPIMIVGEGPGRNEVNEGYPFVGRSGKLLEALCSSAGFNVKQCTVANATLCQPEGGISLMEAAPTSVHHCLSRLEYEISQARPRVIVAAGAAALMALTGVEKHASKWVPNPCASCGDAKTRKKGCTTCGGKKRKLVDYTNFTSEHKISHVAGGVFHIAPDHWLAAYGVRFVIPVYHPSFLLREAQTEAQKKIGGQFVAPMVVAHLKKAFRLAFDEPVWAMTHEVTSDWSVLADYVHMPGTFAIDIETDSKIPFDVTTIKCIGIARQGSSHVLVVDTANAGPELLDVLGQFLTSEVHWKILQNRGYDETVIDRVWGVVVKATKRDTMLSHRAVWPDEPHKLHDIAFRYTDSPPWKPPRTKDGVEQFASLAEFHLYNARDAYNTSRADIALTQEVMTYGLEKIVANDMKMASIAIDMQLAGMPASKEAATRLREKYDGVYNEVLIKLRKAADDNGFKDVFEGELNPNSNKQIGWALFGPDSVAKMVSRVKTKTGQDATNKLALMRAQHPFARDLKALKRAKRARDQIDDLSGRIVGAAPWSLIHPIWKSYGARTGRWSSAEPSMQNLFDFVREIIQVPEGWSIVGADYAQLELRIIAMLAQDHALMKRCLEADETRKLDPEGDPHAYVAAQAFGAGYRNADAATKKILRDITKRIIYGMNYGAGARTIVDNIMSDDDYTGPEIPLAQAQLVMNAYFRSYPGVTAWRQGIEAVVRADPHNAIYSPLLGRRRVFPLGQLSVTELMNFPIQSGAADITDRAMGIIHTRLPEVDPQAWLMAQVHDAIYTVCRDEHVPAVKKLMSDSMYYEMNGMKYVATPKAHRVWSEVS